MLTFFIPTNSDTTRAATCRANRYALRRKSPSGRCGWQAVKSLAFDEIREPFDVGSVPLAAVHGMNCLRFLEEAHAEWKKMPPDWGDEIMSNIDIYAKAVHCAACWARRRAILNPALRAPVKPAGFASGTPSGFPLAPPGFTPMLRSGVAPIVGRHQQNCGARFPGLSR